MKFSRQKYWSGKSKILVVRSFSRGFPQPREQNWVSCISGTFLTIWTTSSDQVSHSVMFNCLWAHGLHHARLPCPSPTPWISDVHWVSDAIEPPHPLSSPSPPAFNLSQHQGLFQGVSYSHQVAKVLEFQLQYQFFQWTLRTNLL